MLKFNTFACLGQVKKTVSGLYMWKKKMHLTSTHF